MNLEHQVSSLAPSQRLRELGVKQDSLFYWEEVQMPYSSFAELVSKPSKGTAKMRVFSAFTVAELGEMLPAFNPDGTPFQMLHCRKNKNSKGDEWSVVYHNQNRGGYSEPFFSDTEADARAKMLIYLIENKLITV